MCCELTAKQVATVVTLCWEKERHEFFKKQANFFEILCLHVPVYRRSGDKGNKHFPDSSGRSRGRAQGACPPYFQTTMRPKGPKKIFFEPPPPHPPHYVKVWIHHWIVSVRWDCITLQLSLVAGYIFTDCILIIKFILL